MSMATYRGTINIRPLLAGGERDAVVPTTAPYDTHALRPGGELREQQANSEMWTTAQDRQVRCTSSISTPQVDANAVRVTGQDINQNKMHGTSPSELDPRIILFPIFIC